MPNVYLYSDPHFSHHGVCKFVRQDGTKLRPWDNPDEMDEELIRLFNETVRPNDKCYFLGDVVINRRGLKVLERLNCKNMVLIKGNHDIFKPEDYMPRFRDIRAYHILDGMLLSHIPVHESCLYTFRINIHGHTHANRIMKFDENGKQTIDDRYFCVCVEQTGFKPISLEEVKKKIKDQGTQEQKLK